MDVTRVASIPSVECWSPVCVYVRWRTPPGVCKGPSYLVQRLGASSRQVGPLGSQLCSSTPRLQRLLRLIQGTDRGALGGNF